MKQAFETSRPYRKNGPLNWPVVHVAHVLRDIIILFYCRVTE